MSTERVVRCNAMRTKIEGDVQSYRRLSTWQRTTSWQFWILLPVGEGGNKIAKRSCNEAAKKPDNGERRNSGGDAKKKGGYSRTTPGAVRS